jgi:hypothetical protein
MVGLSLYDSSQLVNKDQWNQEMKAVRKPIV